MFITTNIWILQEIVLLACNSKITSVQFSSKGVNIFNIFHAYCAANLLLIYKNYFPTTMALFIKHIMYYISPSSGLSYSLSKSTYWTRKNTNLSLLCLWVKTNYINKISLVTQIHFNIKAWVWAQSKQDLQGLGSSLTQTKNYWPCTPLIYVCVSDKSYSS